MSRKSTPQEDEELNLFADPSHGCKRTHAEWISDQSACDHLRYLSIVDAWATQLCKNGSYPPVRVKATNLPSYHLAAVKYTATRNLRSEELCLNYLQMWFQPIWKILCSQIGFKPFKNRTLFETSTYTYIYIDLPVDKSATGLPAYISLDHRWTKSMHGASQKLQIAKESAAIYTDTSVLSSRTPFSQKEIFQAHLSEFCSLKANINIRI